MFEDGIVKDTDALFAQNQIKLHEKILAFRISLQQTLDIVNQYPLLDELELSEEDIKPHNYENSNVLNDLLSESLHALNTQCGSNNEKATKKRKSSSIISWEEVVKPQNDLHSSWESVINKWHSRVNFGSEKSKLKVFNQTIWEQIEIALASDHRVIEKSRVPVRDSKRKRFTSTSPSGEPEGMSFDEEVYEDRHFYSNLLKTFISSSTDASSGGDSMRSADLAALKNFRQKKSQVDRRASKGRKVRYVVHEKLKNFMFPISTYSSLSSSSEQAGGGSSTSQSLFNSLFQ